jgi:tetrahydromethanopterin S-methyltransferase subunit C
VAARTHDPLVRIGLFLYVGVLVGIVFLMTTKPSLATSILAMVVAATLGLAVGLLLWWTSREKRNIGNLAT